MSSPNDPVPLPTVIKAYQPCSENTYSECQDGTYCFRRTSTISVCMPACPSTWQCRKDRVPLYGQCGGKTSPVHSFNTSDKFENSSRR